ncbi:hypothetical protein AMTRI_Chr08g159740 [Amborella trichopoda]
MMLMEVMIMMFFFEFYLNLGCPTRYTPKRSSMETAKHIHAKAGKCGFDCNLCTGIALSSMHCRIDNLLSVDSMLNLTSHRGKISYKIILNGYL